MILSGKFFHQREQDDKLIYVKSTQPTRTPSVLFTAGWEQFDFSHSELWAINGSVNLTQH